MIVAAVITNDGSAITANLIVQGSAAPDTSAMTQVAETDSFTADIPPMPDGTIVRYYVVATDDGDTSAVSPPGAPATTYSYTVGTSMPQVFVNEFMADNDSVNADPDFGAYSDWIELFNAGAAAVDIGGWSLTDDLGSPSKWVFPAGASVGAGGFLLIWADREDTEGEALHASFALNKGGEQIGLYDAARVPVDTLTFGPQATDISYGRRPDGGDSWAEFTAPTPEASNGP